MTASAGKRQHGGHTITCLQKRAYQGQDEWEGTAQLAREEQLGGIHQKAAHQGNVLLMGSPLGLLIH